MKPTIPKQNLNWLTKIKENANFPGLTSHDAFQNEVSEEIRKTY